ncbi:MAG: hypothetical protein M0R51_17575 [Clostridia bacterium]|jgi:hypothetical protein|nr:hypothetical protein [Clostridia bacterium]
MKPYYDIHGNEIKDGDTIKMPHVKENGYITDKSGYYHSKVHYNSVRDCLVDENNIGFCFAYGVEKETNYE